MKKKKEYRLYGVALPLWALVWFPGWWWLLLIPANYLLDSLVLGLCLRKKISDYKSFVLKNSWLTCVFGFISDFAGAAFILGLFLVFQADGIAAHYIITAVGVVISAFFIWLFNAKLSFLSEKIGKENANKVGIWLAVFTAPYLFLLPIYFS